MTVQQEPWAANLTSEEVEKVQLLQEAVLDDIATFHHLKAFCTRGTYVRYLRARSWNLKKATAMLKETLQWRRDFQPHILTWETISHEGRRGKMFLLDHPDKEGRPVVLMRPRNEDVFTGDPEERIKWLVYTLEQASRRADQTSLDGKMTWLIDFVGNTRKNSPPISVSMRTLYILQHHYPERLGRAVSFQPPMLFQITWKAVSPFVDPVTYKKLVFLRHKQEEEAHKALGEHFYMEHIDDTLGGGVPLEELWDFEGYGEKMKVADQEFREVLKIYDDAMQEFEEEEEEEEGEFHDASSDCEVADR